MNKIVLAAALLAVPFIANAADKKAPGSAPSPYVQCGIGGALFPNTAWAAVISNATWDLGTTAITSALSSPETCNAKKVRTATLIIETLEAMEKDVANGGGAYTTALADTMGCDSASRGALVSQMRDSYSANVAQAGYSAQTREERATAVYNSAKAAAGAVAPTCAVSL